MLCCVVVLSREKGADGCREAAGYSGLQVCACYTVGAAHGAQDLCVMVSCLVRAIFPTCYLQVIEGGSNKRCFLSYRTGATFFFRSGPIKSTANAMRSGPESVRESTGRGCPDSPGGLAGVVFGLQPAVTARGGACPTLAMRIACRCFFRIHAWPQLETQCVCMHATGLAFSCSRVCSLFFRLTDLAA